MAVKNQLRVSPEFSDKNPKQVECIDYFYNHPEVTEIYYGGAKMCGKSFLGSFLFVFQALRYPETHYFIARKRITDLSKFLVPSIIEIGEMYKVLDLFNVNLQRNIIEFKNGSKIFLIEAAYYPSDPLYSRYGSMQITQGWIEEAGEIDYDAKVNLQASIGRWKNAEYEIPIKILFTFNPSNNFLNDIYRDFANNCLAPHRKFIAALPTDNFACTADYFNNLKSSLPPTVAKRLLEGRWDFENELTLFKVDKVGKAFRQSRGGVFARRIISVDVAHYGGDRCVIMLFEGDDTFGQFKILSDETTTNAVELVERINTFRMLYGVPKRNCIFDGLGVGSYLKDYLPEATPFQASQKAKKTLGYNSEIMYANARVECLFYLSRQINDEKIAIEADARQRSAIEKELLAIEILEDNRILDVTHKDELKRKLGRSTDYSDAMYMAMNYFIGTNKPYSLKMSF